MTTPAYEIIRPARRHRRRNNELDRLPEAKVRKLRAIQAKLSSLKGHVADIASFGCIRKIVYGDDTFLDFITELEHQPVGIVEFLDSDRYFGACNVELWPEVRKAIIDLNRDWYKGEASGAYEELLAKAGTGTGKSEIAKITTVYHLYLLLCLRNPQKFYALSPTTDIVIMLQSAKPAVTKKILYRPLRQYIESIPWFQKYAPPNKYIDAETVFDSKNVRIVPSGGDTDSILGSAVISVIIDEINWMAVVMRSKRVIDGNARGGHYDQAQTLYDALMRRRQSRFLYKGPRIGVMCFLSSSRYKNDFTERRETQIRDTGQRSAYVYSKMQFEAQPTTQLCGDIFYVIIHNDAASDIEIVVLGDEDDVPDDEFDIERIGRKHSKEAQIIEVPVEYLELFKKDPAGALRDVCGLSSLSIQPFFRTRSRIMDAVEAGEGQGAESILVKDNLVLGLDGMPIVKKGTFCKNPSRPRYVHIDLSRNGDRVGICMIRYDGMTTVGRTTGESEILPVATMEFCCTIQPDHSTEIDIAEVRVWVLQLKKKYGYPIRSITYDGFQSVESQQQIKKRGIKSGQISLDRNSTPYRALRDGLYDGRVLLYQQDVLIDELCQLEFDAKHDKVDHPPSSGKDSCDALCGAYFNLLRRSSTWSAGDIDDERDDGERPDIERD